jgi:hypothetical protein
MRNAESASHNECGMRTAKVTRNQPVPPYFRIPHSNFDIRSSFRVPHSALQAFFLAVVCAATAGCFHSSTLVKVQPDGAGTIEQTLTMRADAAEQLKSMMSVMGGEQTSANAEKKPEAKPFEVFSEQDMRDAAPKFGEGVSFVSSEAINANGRVGRVAFYRFADVRRLRVDQKPSTPPSMDQTGPREDIAFALTKLPNGHSQLSITFPEPKVPPKAALDAAKAESSKAPDPARLEMIKKMLDGLKIGVDVEVAGSIVKTNSPYVQGNRVTLLEMDFAQVLADQQQLAQLSQPASLEEAKQALKNIKGFKVNLDHEITIEFAGH